VGDLGIVLLHWGKSRERAGHIMAHGE
jgi:hypothetical protein